MVISILSQINKQDIVKKFAYKNVTRKTSENKNAFNTNLKEIEVRYLSSNDFGYLPFIPPSILDLIS